MSRVLVIGDPHEPFTHSDYIDFCLGVKKEFRCDMTVCTGDLIDNAGISYHEKDPDGLSPGDELELATQKMKIWKKAFPNLKICLGNHDLLTERKAKTYGIPLAWLRDRNDIFETPNWEWEYEFIIDDVLYIHGKGHGKNAALDTAMKERMSVVQGHAHSWAGVQWNTSTKDRIFGMNAGCGIDITAYTFAYQKKFSVRPVLGCGVVIDGVRAHFIPMEL